MTVTGKGLPGAFVWQLPGQAEVSPAGRPAALDGAQTPAAQVMA
ncbi:hypothetical protein BURK2_01506 [Burkholderiales bacterium]|nr:hypothetical protein BURK2_01506 [Burkholderiales bacterium]